VHVIPPELFDQRTLDRLSHTQIIDCFDEWGPGLAQDPRRLLPLIEAWQADGLLVVGDGRVRLTETGFLLSDSLFVDLL
jgi:hypothetical protein